MLWLDSSLCGWASLDPSVRGCFEVSDVEGPIARILAGMVLPARFAPRRFESGELAI